MSDKAKSTPPSGDGSVPPTSTSRETAGFAGAKGCDSETCGATEGLGKLPPREDGWNTPRLGRAEAREFIERIRSRGIEYNALATARAAWRTGVRILDSARPGMEDELAGMLAAFDEYVVAAGMTRRSLPPAYRPPGFQDAGFQWGTWHGAPSDIAFRWAVRRREHLALFLYKQRQYEVANALHPQGAAPLPDAILDNFGNMLIQEFTKTPLEDSYDKLESGLHMEYCALEQQRAAKLATPDRNSTDRSARSEDRGARRMEWLAKAMLTVRDHPDWKDAQIARHLGIDKSRLSRSKEYKLAAKIARAKEPTKGFITTSRGTKQLEAQDDSFDPNRPASLQSEREKDLDDRLDREINERNTQRNKYRGERP